MSNRKRFPKAKVAKKRRTPPSVLFGIIIIFLFGMVSYWNSFDAPLVFDDFLSIQRNAGVRLGDALTPGALGGRSLLYVTFAINYALHLQDVWGYHLVNLIFHLLNGILILFVATHIFRKIGIEETKAITFAVLSAALFVVHPVQTESVTYISSRSELLSTCFYLIALLLFAKAPDRYIGFGLSLVIATVMYMGLLSKETVISLPAVLVVYDFIFRSEGSVRRILGHWKFYITFVVGGTGAAYFLVTGPLSGAVGGSLPGHLTPWHYLLTQSRVIVRYIQLVFLPMGLNLDYDFEPSASLFEPMVLASSILIFGLIALAWYLRRRAAVVSFSIFWFFLTLAPTSSVVPILDVIFEHRLYLPMVGLCLSFPLFFQWLARLVKSRTSLTLKPVPICAGLLVILTVGTILRNEVWRDEITLWSDVVAKSPDKARGYNALAMSHFRRAEFESALKVARVGFERLPQHEAQFVDTIGNVYLQLGRYDEAVTAFRSAIESEEARAVPDRRFLSLEYNNVGVTQLYMWRLLRENEQQVTPGEFARRKVKILEPALEAFRKSLELEEETFTALDSLVNVTHWLGRQEEMRREHLAILEGGDEFRASYVLAKLAFNDNDFEAALEHFDRAVQHRSSEHLLWFNYAYAFERLGRLDEAILKYLEATRVNPVFIEAHHNVALLYMKKSEFEVAVEHFEEVLRLYPDHESTNLHLAKIYIYNGQHSLARKHLTIVLHGSPEHPEALSLWQQL